MDSNVFFYVGEYQDISQEKFKIFKQQEINICSINFSFSIIGYSHCIYSKELNYLDYFSNKNSNIFSKNLSLKDDIEYEKKIDTAYFSINISVKCSSLDLLKSKFSNAQLYYEFSENALTSIIVNDEGYETFHTYPEYNRAVYTKVIFKKILNLF